MTLFLKCHFKESVFSAHKRSNDPFAITKDGNKNTVFNNLHGRVTRKSVSLKRFFRRYVFLSFSLSLLFLLTCPVTNIRLRNLCENSNLAGFRGRAGIVSRRGKALKTSPRPFICSTPFQRWRHNSRGKRVR